jgi:hypothetical protein
MLGFLLKAIQSAARWWSSDKADWKSVVVTWSGRRLYPLHWMKRLLLKRSIMPRILDRPRTGWGDLLFDHRQRWLEMFGMETVAGVF